MGDLRPEPIALCLEAIDVVRARVVEHAGGEHDMGLGNGERAPELLSHCQGGVGSAGQRHERDSHGRSGRSRRASARSSPRAVLPVCVRGISEITLR